MQARVHGAEIRLDIEPEVEAELLLACMEGIGSVLDHQLGRLRSA